MRQLLEERRVPVGAVEAAAHVFALRGAPEGLARTLVAENTIELGAARATLSHSAGLADESDGGSTAERFGVTQAAKAFVTEAAVRIVDRALALSGGAGYLNGHPLARAYRDVRAGGFMHQLGANRAYEFLAEVALGREPALH